MQYQEFGKTGLRVSKLCLGTWGIGGAGWDSYSDESRMDAIKAALECGINFIDTAPAYNAGKAECYVGETLSKLKKRREVVISTKCGNKFVDGKYLRCGSKESILKQCDESLKNLKTDYIDIYLVHWPDPDVELEETIDAVSTLKKEGKILHAGVSNFSKEQIEEAQKYCKIEAFQPQYSLADRKDEKLIRWAHEQGLGIMTYGTLGGGILTGNYRKLRTFEQTDSRTIVFKSNGTVNNHGSDCRREKCFLGSDRREMGDSEEICIQLHHWGAEPCQSRRKLQKSSMGTDG